MLNGTLPNFFHRLSSLKRKQEVELGQEDVLHRNYVKDTARQYKAVSLVLNWNAATMEITVMMIPGCLVEAQWQ